MAPHPSVVREIHTAFLAWSGRLWPSLHRMILITVLQEGTQLKANAHPGANRFKATHLERLAWTPINRSENKMI
jgi:hypothetical protein